jgi:tryptophanyl-tRNA synthetase
MSDKDIVLSASTTSGNLTLGNYIGAINHWREMQERYDCYFMVANLHALTTPQDPIELKERSLSFFAQYIALGLDPDKVTLFIQSQVPAHAELSWILSCLVPLGHLNKMTQFKDKSAKQKSVLSGLLMYPVLMASDILLYQAKYVPVGHDQKQHLELCRNIVDLVHHRYGPVFTMPEPLIAKRGARVMSLSDPTNKMSKSDPNPASYISILDDPKTVLKKFKKAVTDSGNEVRYDPESKGLANLMTIYSVLTGKEYAEIEHAFEGRMYGHLKVELAELVNETLSPVRAKYQELMTHKDELERLIIKGRDKAQLQANETLETVYDRLGVLR